MFRFISNLLRHPTSRIVFTIVSTVIFIGLGNVFLINELNNNSENYYEEYTKKQQDLTVQLANEVKYMLTAEMTDNQIVDELVKNPINSSTRWCFMGKDDVLLQAKDANSLVQLEHAKIDSCDGLIEWLHQKNQIITTTDVNIGEHTYTIGIMSDYNTITIDSGISSHKTFVMMTFVFVCMTFFVIIVYCIIILNNRDQTIKDVSKDLQRKGRSLEALSTESVSNNSAYEEVAATVESYDESIVLALLQQAMEEELLPIGIMCLKMKMSSRYYEKDELLGIMEQVKEYLRDNQLAFEVGKGEFVILLFRTSLKDIEKIQKTIKAFLKTELVKHDMTAKIACDSKTSIQECKEESLVQCYNRLKRIF